MHNLAALARRFEEKRAAERAGAPTASTPAAPHHCDNATGRGGSQSTQTTHGEDDGSPRRRSVNTSRFSDANCSRSSSHRPRPPRRASDPRGQRVLVVPLDPRDESSLPSAVNPAQPQSRPSSLKSSHDAAAAPCTSHQRSPKTPDRAKDAHQGGDESTESSPMVSLAWVPPAPPFVSPVPLSLATEGDDDWVDVEVDLSSSESSLPSQASPWWHTSGGSENRPYSALHQSGPDVAAAPVLIDFYVERDVAPVADVPSQRQASRPTSVRTTTDAQARYQAVRQSSDKLHVSASACPAERQLPTESDRRLFRSFLDDATRGGESVSMATPPRQRRLTRATDGVCSSVQLSEQRVSAATEVDRLQWELVVELCCAIRPFAKVLLLRLMTAAEAGPEPTSSATEPHTGQRSASGAGGAAYPSTVPLTCCVETINTLLAQHGVDHVRATQCLCREMAEYRWETGGRSARTGQSDLGDGEGSSSAGLVEYATLVAHVLEIAHTADSVSA